MHRRLPIYLLLDCSESMAGAPWAAMKDGMDTMIRELQSDPMALETAAISIITFANKAKQVVPLTDITRLQTPRIIMGSGTAMGAALKVWVDAMATEVKRTTAEQKGDYKPVVFILTDGEPTDNWDKVAKEVRNNVAGKKANVIAVGCGPDVDFAKLRLITDTVLNMSEADSASFTQFFKWVTASVSTASMDVAMSGAGPSDVPTLPNAGLERAPENPTGGAPASKYAFLHARCVSRKNFFLYRYLKHEAKGMFGRDKSVYECKEVIPIAENEFDFASASSDSTLSAAALGDPLPCPSCGNQAWAMCPNGHVHCCPLTPNDVTLSCPWCDTTAVYQSANFDVGRGAG